MLTCSWFSRFVLQGPGPVGNLKILLCSWLRSEIVPTLVFTSIFWVSILPYLPGIRLKWHWQACLHGILCTQANYTCMQLIGGIDCTNCALFWIDYVIWQWLSVIILSESQLTRVKCLDIIWIRVKERNVTYPSQTLGKILAQSTY